jgi:phosphoesterase RecJ-like protein
VVQHAVNSGKTVFWGGADPFSPIYSFLPQNTRYQVLSSVQDIQIPDKYAVVSLDTSTLDRSVSGLRKRGDGYPDMVINIDHHGDNEKYGDIIYVDTESSSTGEILWEFFRLNQIDITYDMAIGLYTAIVTDCGNFTYSITSGRTHLAASDLLQKGIRPEIINKLIYQNQTVEGMNLWGKAFSHASIVYPGCVFSWLSKEDFNISGASYSDTENLVSKLLFLKDVEFAALFVEEDDQVRISLRSSGPISARDIASVFGGGGHIPAAGCRMHAPLKTARQRVMEEIIRQHEIRDNNH